MDVVAAARQLQTGRHRVETVEALRPHLEQLPKAQVAGIARELGYNAISTLPKGEMIHKLISNLKGISLSKQRVWEIEHGRSRPVAFDENPFAAGPPAAAEAGREGGGQGEVAPSPAAVVKRAIGDAIRAGNHQAFPFGQHVHRIPMKVLRDALAKAGIHDRAAQDEAIYEATWRDKAAKGKGKHSVTGLHATPEEHESYKHHALPGVGEQFGAFEVPVAHAGFWTGGEGGAAPGAGAAGGDAAAGHEPEPATPPAAVPESKPFLHDQSPMVRGKAVTALKREVRDGSDGKAKPIHQFVEEKVAAGGVPVMEKEKRSRKVKGERIESVTEVPAIKMPDGSYFPVYSKAALDYAHHLIGGGKSLSKDKAA